MQAKASPFLGQVRLVPYAGFMLGQALRCWKTDDDGAVCSNLMYYSPGCPTTPPLTEKEILAVPPEASGAT
jgi:hypothetical protein